MIVLLSIAEILVMLLMYFDIIPVTADFKWILPYLLVGFSAALIAAVCLKIKKRYKDSAVSNEMRFYIKTRDIYDEVAPTYAILQIKNKKLADIARKLSIPTDDIDAAYAQGKAAMSRAQRGQLLRGNREMLFYLSAKYNGIIEQDWIKPRHISPEMLQRLKRTADEYAIPYDKHGGENEHEQNAAILLYAYNSGRERFLRMKPRFGGEWLVDFEELFRSTE